MDLFLNLSTSPIHIVGHALDAFLFVFLVDHFFLPRRGTSIPRTQSIWAICIISVILLIEDRLAQNNFYAYCITITVLPLIYSLLFFKGHWLSRVTICTLFTLLIACSEAIIIFASFEFFYIGEQVRPIIQLLSFILRRIVSKGILFFVIKKALIWPRESSIDISDKQWSMIFFVTLCDAIMYLLIIDCADLIGHWIVSFSTMYLSIIPIVMLLIVKWTSLEAEKRRVLIAQTTLEKTQNQYLQQQIATLDSLKKFRHDYKAHLFAIDMLLTSGKYDELHQYLLSLHQTHIPETHLKQFTENEALNILLNQKVATAEKLRIRFQTHIQLSDSGAISASDLISLISNLCDNALEACAVLPDAYIRLDIHPVKAYLMIEISNSCQENILQTNPEFRTKKAHPDQHGMGIRIIRHITQKYSGQYHISCTDNTFTTNILLLDE